MAKHKKKDAKAARRQSVAIRGMLAKLGRLRVDLLAMIASETKTERDPVLALSPRRTEPTGEVSWRRSSRRKKP